MQNMEHTSLLVSSAQSQMWHMITKQDTTFVCSRAADLACAESTRPDTHSDLCLSLYCMAASHCVKCLARLCLEAARCLIGRPLRPSVSPRNAVPCRHAHAKLFMALREDGTILDGFHRDWKRSVSGSAGYVGHAATKENLSSTCGTRRAPSMLWHSRVFLQLVHVGHDWPAQPLCSSVAFLNPGAVFACDVRARREQLLQPCASQHPISFCSLKALPGNLAYQSCNTAKAAWDVCWLHVCLQACVRYSHLIQHTLLKGGLAGSVLPDFTASA